MLKKRVHKVMTMFLLFFFTIYGGMHLYAFLKFRSAFAPGAGASICLIFFMLLMLLAPIIIRQSEKHGFELTARIMSYAGYSWMGILLLFCAASFAVDVYRLLVYSGGFILRKDLSHFSLSARLSFLVPFLVSIVISVYGFFEARNIRTERITIKTTKIPAEIKSLRIVQISDVHIGLIVRDGRVERILDEVKKAEPDILVSTGDLVDGQINNLAGLAELFTGINPRYGKFAVTGNHEFYAGLPQALDFTEKAGFKMLRGAGVTVAGIINIAGVDDPQAKSFGVPQGIPEKELLSEFNNGKFTILLKHRPLIDKSSPGLFDLQLSGHVHNGQIFPFSIITWLYYSFPSGFYNLPDNSDLYVSRGAGTWGPPIRFLSPPEVTVIEIVYKKD